MPSFKPQQWLRRILHRMTGLRNAQVLLLRNGMAEVYVLSSGRIDLATPTPLTSAVALNVWCTGFAVHKHPWLILVDQSDELFWWDHLPSLRGKSKAIWLDKLASKHSESPLRLFELSKPKTKVKGMAVTGVVLEQHEQVTAWVKVLLELNAKVQGIYIPAMFHTDSGKPWSHNEPHLILSAHPQGIRQTVFDGKRLIFSRLAMGHFMDRASIKNEVLRLEDYLIAKHMLPTSTQLPVLALDLKDVLQDDEDDARHFELDQQHYVSNTRDVAQAYPQFKWSNTVENRQELRAMAAMLTRPPRHQLAPAAWLAIYTLGQRIKTGWQVALASVLIFASFAAHHQWHILQLNQGIEVLIRQSADLSVRYESIAKSFPRTPAGTDAMVAAVRLMDWLEAQPQANPALLLGTLGHALEDFPHLKLLELQWGTQLPPEAAKPKDQPPGPPQGQPAKPVVAPQSLRVRGTMTSNQSMRDQRDTVTQFTQALQAHAGLKVKVIRMPYDLQTDSAFTGGATTNTNQPTFELQLWMP